MLNVLRPSLPNLLLAHDVVFFGINTTTLVSFTLDEMLKLQERALERNHDDLPLFASLTARGCIRRR